MIRRQLIIAGSAVLGGTLVPPLMAKTAPKAPVGSDLSDNDSGAILPIEIRQRRPALIRSIQVAHCWPAQVVDPRRPSLYFDLVVEDAEDWAQSIAFWSVVRRGSSTLTASRVRMNFPTGATLGARTLQRRHDPRFDAIIERVWAARIPNATTFVLAGERSGTGTPPQALDLRYEPRTRALKMADGSPRDFDAVLVETD
jgi:hypothetical protein